MEIKKQEDFPLLEEYKKHFKVNENTIFAYNHVIYSNNDLPEDILIHEKQHFVQQDREGLDYWVQNYLNDPKYRLRQEIDAYKKQLAHCKPKGFRRAVMLDCIDNLVNGMYGDIITRQEAYRLLS
jgi:hypothetical protein